MGKKKGRSGSSQQAQSQPKEKPVEIAADAHSDTAASAVETGELKVGHEASGGASGQPVVESVEISAGAFSMSFHPDEKPGLDVANESPGEAAETGKQSETASLQSEPVSQLDIAGQSDERNGNENEVRSKSSPSITGDGDVGRKVEPKSSKSTDEQLDQSDNPAKRHWIRTFLPVFLLIAIIVELCVMNWVGTELTKPQSVMMPEGGARLVNPS